ncbi:MULTISPECIES: hypothetical protein [unclassified Streptomyces]|uniref:hypothetical protein n=1 Tax=unclassified Streptomyces TaxID=2593676 RepID=UPI002E17457E|nr:MULTISPECIES: hypothetical protein [unclassified Streptomyces]
MKVLGVSVASGVIYYGALDAAQAPTTITSAPERLVPAAGLTGAERLADTYQRITQDIRVLRPFAVVLVGTRKHGNWRYRDAAERASLMAAVMLACAHEGVRCEEWTTEKIGTAVEVPAKSLADFDFTAVGLEQRAKYWRQGRGPAFAAAMAYLSTSTPGRSRADEGDRS